MRQDTIEEKNRLQGEYNKAKAAKDYKRMDEIRSEYIAYNIERRKMLAKKRREERKKENEEILKEFFNNVEE